MPKFSSKSKFAIALAVGVAISACALDPTPDAKKTQSLAMPHAEVPSTWASNHAQGEVVDGWLASFNDAELNALVQESLAYNADLKIAATNVDRAQAYTQASASSLYPSVTAAALQKENDAYSIKSAGISVSWEIDLWGRVRYGDRAAKSKLAAAEADFSFAKRSLAALVAKSWFHAIETNKQLALAEETATLNEKLLSLAQDLKRIGKGIKKVLTTPARLAIKSQLPKNAPFL
jgi:outer membrane protein TolC